MVVATLVGLPAAAGADPSSWSQIHDGASVRGFGVVAPDLEELLASLNGEGFEMGG